MATWPETLPTPEFKGYALSVNPNILRTEMDAGTTRQRLRYRQNIDRVDVIWDMTAEQFNTFEQFHSQEINNGTSWFDIPLADGQGIRQMEARFVEGKYSSAPEDRAGTKWKVSAELEVRNRR